MHLAGSFLIRAFLGASLMQFVLFAQTFTFTPKKFPFPSPNNTGGVVPLDLNGDGNTDIAVRLDAGNYVFLGDGQGGFNPKGVPLAVNAFNIYEDLNGDGKADILVLYPGADEFPGLPAHAGEFSVSIGDGKGNFKQTTYMELPNADTWTYTVADFNNDGRPDIAYLDVSSIPADGETAVTIFMNMGNGVFKQTLHQALANYPFEILAGDFNADGNIDLAWPESEPLTGSNYAIHYMYGNGDGSFQPVRTYTLDAQPGAMFAGDLNHDGRMDLALAVGSPKALNIFRFATLLAKQTSGFYWSSNFVYAPINNAVELTDFNGDGQPDLLVAFPWVLFPGKPGGRFGSPQALPSDIVIPSFAPLKKGGLPAIFDTGDPSALRIFVNTSKK